MDVAWFVGQRDDLARLDALVTGVASGVGGVVLVQGEQGIGRHRYCGWPWPERLRLAAGSSGEPLTSYCDSSRFG